MTLVVRITLNWILAEITSIGQNRHLHSMSLFSFGNKVKNNNAFSCTRAASRSGDLESGCVTSKREGRQQMVNGPLILAVVIVVILALSGGYYISTDSGASGANSVIVNIEVTAGLYGENASQFPDEFLPQNFTVTEGQHVTIVFDNTDDGPHELVIPQFGVTTGIVQGGQTVRVSFVPNQVGTFGFDQPQGVCDYGNLSAQQGGCTGVQETNGNMTVLAP